MHDRYTSWCPKVWLRSSLGPGRDIMSPAGVRDSRGIKVLADPLLAESDTDIAPTRTPSVSFIERSSSWSRVRPWWRKKKNAPNSFDFRQNANAGKHQVAGPPRFPLVPGTAAAFPRQNAKTPNCESAGEGQDALSGHGASLARHVPGWLPGRRGDCSAHAKHPTAETQREGRAGCLELFFFLGATTAAEVWF